MIGAFKNLLFRTQQEIAASPYLNLISQEFTWAQGGIAEMFGALWPGEQAWKIELEATRMAGFAPDEVRDMRVRMPAIGTVSTLTNQWEHDGITVKLEALASPNVEHSGDFRWVAKWWGEDKNETYSLALRVLPDLKSRRLTVVHIEDQNGPEAKILEHRGQDESNQAVFFKPMNIATNLVVTFALQRSRFFTFVSRPKFADTNLAKLHGAAQ